MGNLQYRMTARNFNRLCAMAGRITVAEVEELVDVDEIGPEQVDTPSIYVHHIVVGKHEITHLRNRFSIKAGHTARQRQKSPGS